MRAGAGAGVVGDDHWMAAGGDDARCEAGGAQVVRGPFSGALAVGSVVRLGADAGDAQELEQPRVGGRARGGDVGEDGVEDGALVGHGRIMQRRRGLGQCCARMGGLLGSVAGR
jgi:hypothetical protein